MIGQFLTADIVTGPPALQLQLDWELRPNKRFGLEAIAYSIIYINRSIVACIDVYSSIGYYRCALAVGCSIQTVGRKSQQIRLVHYA